jgi:uncharacterized protein YecE (DUF72 family)
MPGRVYVGTSGWLYGSWRGSFYPDGLRHADELGWTSHSVGSIEINGTFYSLQRPSSFRAWRAQTPPGFPIAVKGSRFITHMKKLRDVETALANFWASGLLALGDRLGPVLWQFPASMPLDAPRFEAFFDALPRTTCEASRLAKRHDERVAGRSYTRATSDLPIRYAVEVRHPSFFGPEFIALLRRRGIALAVSDGATRWPLREDVTADFVYVRLHGAEELYVSGYTDAALDHWATRIRSWRAGRSPRGSILCAPAAAPDPRGRDVYVYFDNDAKVHAPFDAMALMDRLGLRADEQGRPEPRATRRRRAPGSSQRARIARELAEVRAPARW